MDEVRVIARCVAREGKKDEVRALLQGVLTLTRAEPGCRLYELYESSSGGRFYFYETWESQAALDQHVANPDFKHLEQNIGELEAEPLRGKTS